MDINEIKNWVRQSKNGNKEAFSALIRFYQPKIFSLVFRILCNEDEARDIMQDTFLKAWLQLNKYSPEFQFSTWLSRIAINLSYDKLKCFQKKHTVKITETDLQVLSDPFDLEEQIDNRQLAETIKNFTEELSPKQRILFTLRYLEGMDMDEIKQITGLSAAKIKSNLYLARQTIHNQLKQFEK